MAYSVHDEPIPGYRLVKFLGRGGFGEVWKATSPGGIHVALKVINLGGREGLKEFKALKLFKSIHDPHLTPITAFWLKDEHGYLVDESQADTDGSSRNSAGPPRGTMMVSDRVRPKELIIAMGLGDKSLSDRLEECQKAGMQGIPPRELFEYLEAAARAIDFLNSPRHDLGKGPISPIQHCDIKPQNILIVGSSAQVCDFGLARELGANVKLTTVAASPAYGAPECIEGKPPSASTDQYSLAVSYVEMRTGVLPFGDPESYAGVIAAHLNSKLDLSRLADDERKIIKKATSRDPAQRYPSALKMVRALSRACAEELESIRFTEPVPNEKPGVELVAGYKLEKPIRELPNQRVWSAKGPDSEKVALLVHDLEKAPIDQRALEVMRAMPAHPRLAAIQTSWLVDKENKLITGPTDGTVAIRASKLIVASGLVGRTLVDRANECEQDGARGIPPDELLLYLHQIAEAIDYLNSPKHRYQGKPYSVIHCNVRPDNFMWKETQARLGNFASARLLFGSKGRLDPPLPASDSVFDAPEIRDGRVTRWSDQFSLAVSYVQLRFGKLPPPSSGIRRRKSAANFSPDLGQLSPAEAEVIERALSEDASSRFGNCLQFIEELRIAKPVELTKLTRRVGTTSRSQPVLLDARVDSEGHVQPVLDEPPDVIDTPRSRVRDTYIEPLDDDEADGQVQRRRGAGGRLLKTLAALLALGLVGAAIFLMVNHETGASALAAATADFNAADKEESLAKQVRLLQSVVERCRPYTASEEFARLDKQAAERLESLRDRAKQAVRADLDAALQLTDLDTLAAALKTVIADCRQYEQAFPDDRVLVEVRNDAELHQARVSEKQGQKVGNAGTATPSGGDAARLLAAAEGQWRDRDFAALNRTLDGARTLNSADAQQSQQFAELRALAAIAEPSGDSTKINRSLADYQKWLDPQKREATRLVDLSAALDDLAGRQAQYLPGALHLARTAWKSEPDAARQEQIAERLRKLYVGRIGQRIKDERDDVRLDDSEVIAQQLLENAERGAAPPGDGKQGSSMQEDAVPGSKAYFTALQSLCQRARTDGVTAGLVVVALAECTLESGDQLAARTREAMDRAVEATGPQDEFSAYARYVRLRARNDQEAWTSVEQSTLKELSDRALATGDAVPAGLATTFRRLALARLLSRSAAGLRTPVEVDGRLNLASIMYPYGTQQALATAAQAQTQLTSARKLLALVAETSQDASLAEPSLVALANEVLATRYRQESVTPELKQELEPPLQKLLKHSASLGTDKLPLLYVTISTFGNRVDTVRLRAELVSLLLRARPTDSEAVEIYRELVVPISEASLNSISPPMKKELARIFNLKGEMLRDYPAAHWYPSLTDAHAAAQKRLADMSSAFSTASNYDQSSVLYLVNIGFSRLANKDADPDTVLREAEVIARKAVKMDPQAERAHGLLGKVLLGRARRADRAAGAQLAKEAVENFGLALARPNTLDSHRLIYLLDQGTSYLEWADNAADDTDRKNLLDKAHDVINQANRIDRSTFNYEHYRTLGNHCEEDAWLVLRSSPQHAAEYFRQAIAAFSEAIKLDDANPSAWTDRGRVRLKCQRDGGQRDQDYVEQALADLKAALDRTPELAMAHRWLGEVYLTRKNFTLADAELGKAVAVAKAKKSADMNALAVEWVRAKLLSGAPGSEVRARIEQVEPEMTDQAMSKELKVLRGESYEREAERARDAGAIAKRPQDVKELIAKQDLALLEAYQSYNGALGPDLASMTPADSSLLAHRGALSYNWLAQLAMLANVHHGKGLDNLSPAVALADLERAIQLTSVADPNACFVAGRIYFELANRPGVAPVDEFEYRTKAVDRFGRALDGILPLATSTNLDQWSLRYFQALQDLVERIARDSKTPITARAKAIEFRHRSQQLEPLITPRVSDVTRRTIGENVRKIGDARL